DEEITHLSAIADLLKRDADASIFRNLGIKYGSAVRFKTEFSNTVPVRQLSSSPRLKPTMGEMSGFNPEMKRLYLSKYVDLLSILYVGLQHMPILRLWDFLLKVMKFFVSVQNVNPVLPVREHVKRKTSAISQSCGKKFRATLDKTPPEQDNAAQNLSDSGESLSTLSPYESSDSESQRTPTVTRSPSEIKAPSTLTSSPVAIKAVFGKLLTRENSVDILKSKFDVKQSNLTNLTASQVMSVLVKKLVRHNYVTLKENVSSLDAVTVYKEIGT
ncbi:unnamed protein product, partial [Porites lobata]